MLGSAMEHRWGKRVSVDIPVRLRCRASAVVEARIVNISRSGALIRTNLPLTVMARVDIYLNEDAISSFVTRVESSGIGVEWCESSSEILGTVLRAQPPTPNPTGRRGWAEERLPGQSAEHDRHQVPKRNRSKP